MEEFTVVSAKKLMPGGNFYCFTDRLFAMRLWELCRKAGLKPKNIIVWAKPNPVPNTRRNYNSASEFIVYAVKPGADYTWNKLDVPEMGDVWTINKSTGEDRRFHPHPCQKPVELMERIIEISSNPGDLVVDCFAGSGSTGIAAYNLKRRSILIEGDPRYIKMIKERIALVDVKK